MKQCVCQGSPGCEFCGGVKSSHFALGKSMVGEQNREIARDDEIRTSQGDDGLVFVDVGPGKGFSLVLIRHRCHLLKAD